jgi:hypothetical protein
MMKWSASFLVTLPRILCATGTFTVGQPELPERHCSLDMLEW